MTKGKCDEGNELYPYRAGDLVRATAGRERGGLFLVCRAEGRRVVLCDGRTRKRANAKCKNVRHVVPTGVQSVRFSDAFTDAEIRKEIKRLSEEVF